jgi:hypothetical protein
LSESLHLDSEEVAGFYWQAQEMGPAGFGWRIDWRSCE